LARCSSGSKSGLEGVKEDNAGVSDRRIFVNRLVNPPAALNLIQRDSLVGINTEHCSEELLGGI